MRRFATMMMAALLAGAPAAGAAQAPAPAPAPAQAAAPSPTDALFEAASRGDLGPAARALADPATGADLRALLRARLAAARLDPAARREPALARLAGADADPALRRAALGILTAAAFADGDYAAAARHGRPLAEALAAAGMAEEAQGADQTWRLAALLAGQPAQGLAGAVAAGSTPARTDRVGLPRIDIEVNGQAQDAVFDTGAALSVLSAETARRLGVTVLGGEAAVANGVQGNVGVRVGIAARVAVAGNILTNVPFLIIDDANLTFPVPGGYDIKAILGLPAMRALGRLRMEPARLSVLPAAAPAGAGPANMNASGNSLFVEVAFAGRPVPLLLDTGANQTSLSALYAEADRERVAALATSEARMASAGGARAQRIATWTDAPVALAGRSLRLPSVPVALPGEGGRAPRSYGTLGSNLLRAFASYTLDFPAMRLELGEPLAAPGQAAAAANN